MFGVIHVEDTLSTLLKLKIGQKLNIRMGILKIDKNPNRIYRWFTGDSKYVIYYYLDQLFDSAIVYGVPINLKIIDAIENYKTTYINNHYVQHNFTLLQKKLSQNYSYYN